MGSPDDEPAVRGIHDVPTRLIPEGAPAPPQAHGVAIDRTIGRFELIRELARGGMGQVFLGRDTKLGRKVAIKFLLHDDPRFLERFLVEARATARCTHENIVTIYEVGEHDGLPYMVLEYLEGRTLNDVLDAGPTLRQFVEIVVPVVRALERAHEHGIVHRDLKPHNIFVTDRGQVKVLDFGIARMIDRDDADVVARATAVMAASSELTDANSLIGTVPYMSPEQFGADAVDHQSDLWAIGILFWRALIGVHPAGSTVPQTIKERVRDLATPLPSIGAYDPAIPHELVAIVDRCLIKRKAERYPSATDLLADLQAFLVPSEERRDDACPYRGLAAFGERDAKYFFGRADETRTAIAQLDRWPLLAVVGPSGVGKSSFVHAGVVPALRATGGDWQVHVLRPGRAPLHRLAALIDDGLASRLADEPGVFGVALRGRHGKTLIVVDQLEELFTICDDARVRDVFLRALLAAADDPGSPVRVVLAMRADFLDRVAAHGALVPELTRGLFFLTAPDPAVLREALERPAELAGYAFEDRGIVDDMLQAATGRGALPLLAFTASRLWDARDRERKLLTVSAYRAIGGVGGAFALHADRVASAVPPPSQPLLRAIVTRLVTPDGTRAVVERADLRSLSADPREVDLIVDQLVHARLIHAETDGDVELVHEILITEWPTLRQWLDDSLATRAFTHELGQAAKQWHAHGRPDDLVWRGATAHDALGIAKRHVLDLASTERDFLAAIDKQLARGRRRRVLAFASIVGVLGLGLAGASVAAVRIKLAETEAQDKAQQAETARRDVEQANAKLQAQIDAVAAANRQAQAAEDDKRAADEQRRKAEAETQQSMAQNAETKRRADAERLRANRSTEKLKATQQELDATHSEQRAKDDERRRKAQQKGIVVDDLLGKPKAE